MNAVCLHCWHSDPDTSGKYRWFCCRAGCEARCRQNYLDVRKCRHCLLRTLVDAYGFCGICGEYLMSWIFERTLADTLKPDQAQVVEEYLAVRELPGINDLRRAIANTHENRHVSAHGHMRLGNGGSSSSKILNRRGGRHHRPSGRKQDASYYRRVSFKEDEPLMPTDEFWALFERVQNQWPSVEEMEKLSDNATPERIGVVQYINASAAKRQREKGQRTIKRKYIKRSLENALAQVSFELEGGADGNQSGH